MSEKLIIKERYLTNGYIFQVVKCGKVSSLIVIDRNCYPDTDSRSNDYWRSNGLTIPINNDNDLKRIGELFQQVFEK